MDAILSRRSVRKFKDKKIPKEVLDKILDAGRWAPSGMNTQPWVFIVIDDERKKNALRTSYDFIREELGMYKQDSAFLEKATLVLACMEAEKPASMISVSLAVENMLVAAKSLGVDSLIMTTHMTSEEGKMGLTQLFALPGGLQLHSLLAFGYGDEKPEPKERKQDGATFYHNKYGDAYKLSE